MRKVIRKPPPPHWIPQIGFLTTKGVITDFSNIEFEKQYLTAKRLWITDQGAFYKEEMEPVAIYLICDEPLVKFNRFLADDLVYPQVVDEITENAIHYRLRGFNGLILPEYKDQPMVAPRLTAVKVLPSRDLEQFLIKKNVTRFLGLGFNQTLSVDFLDTEETVD